jgi:hypothetical protein
VSLRIRSPLELPPALREQLVRELEVAPSQGAPAKRPKYGNQVAELEGECFDSKWELKRYLELLEQQAAGLIADLRHHVSFALHALTPAGDRVRIGAYEADMVYRRGTRRTPFDAVNPHPMPPALLLGPSQEGVLVVEDTKSEATRRKELYRWKAAHFEAEYGLKVLDVVRVRRKRADREVRCG